MVFHELSVGFPWDFCGTAMRFTWDLVIIKTNTVVVVDRKEWLIVKLGFKA